jgi:hypothetical protein
VSNTLIPSAWAGGGRPGAGRRPAAWAHGSADLYGGAAHHVRMAGLDPCVRGAQRRSWVHGAQPQVIAGSLEVDRRPERSVVGALVTGAIHGDAWYEALVARYSSNGRVYSIE